MLTRNDNRKSKKRKRQKYYSNTNLSSNSFNFLIKNTRFDAEEILDWFR